MRPMPVAVLFVLVAALPAAAHRARPGKAGDRVAAAADAARRAYRDGDADALAGIASRLSPDPWHVAEALLACGAHDAADALARSVSSKDLEALPRYLASRRAGHPDPSPVAEVDRLAARAKAKEEAGRLAQASTAYDDAAQAAARLGWLAAAAHWWYEAGHCAWRRADHDSAHLLWTKLLEVQRERRLRTDVAFALGNLGNVLGAMGRLGEAREHQLEALRIVSAEGDREGRAHMLLNLGQIERVMGSYGDAREHLEEALSLHDKIEDPALYATTLANLGYLETDSGHFERARRRNEQALRIFVGLRDRGNAARSVGNLGNAYYTLGRYPEAIRHLDEALRILEPVGDRAAVARTLATLGLVHQARGDYDIALDCHARSLRLEEGLRDPIGMAATLRMIGDVHAARGSFYEALEVLERALDLVEDVNSPPGVAATILGLGRVHAERGDYDRARSFFQRARTTYEEIGDRAGVASALGALAAVDLALGDFAGALSGHERALEIFETLGNPARVATATANVGLVYEAIGDVERSLAWQERALAPLEAAGERADVARSLGNLGATLLKHGDPEGALDYLRRAEEVSGALGDRIGVASARANAGRARRALGDAPGARRDLERALGILEEVKARAGMASARWDLGSLLLEAGKAEEGARLQDRALREAREIRAAPLRVPFLAARGRAQLEAGHSGEHARAALRSAQRALEEMEPLLGGLGEEAGARARAEHVAVFEVGIVAAARLERPGDMFEFLESGRAGSLLESLGGRLPLRWADLPEKLHRDEVQAGVDEARARRLHARALDGGDLREVRVSAARLDAALEKVRAVAARFQREAKRQAGLLCPRPRTLEGLQERLEPHEALVLYALALGEALALVVTPKDARIVTLGDGTALARAAGAFDVESAGASRAASDPLADLRARLVEPLHLPEDATSVLVSPEGPLCYLPFGALFAGRTVALTPSGTTHALLREEERGRGEKILALGDPDYAHDPDIAAGSIFRPRVGLPPLPQTRAEAKAVGDVVLLGRDANAARLVKALRGRNRWRALHLACHGLVDAEHPMCSSLALARAGEDDGFLTAIEVLRMDIPADLTVLSACETAKGRVVKGEGILGLTRAFLYAGAPRVICSLWRVDDKATRDLMTRFYEVWRGDVGAAEALRRAQAHVRSRPQWKHPKHWAAWVLWGLPD